MGVLCSLCKSRKSVRPQLDAQCERALTQPGLVLSRISQTHSARLAVCKVPKYLVVPLQ